MAFAAPSNTTLAASTTYYLVIYTVGTFNASLGGATSNDEDSGGAAGWSVADVGHFLTTDVPGASNSWTDDPSKVGIRVNGPAASTTDATLSALTAKTATSETGTYTALNFGTFSAANTSYAQNVPAATTHLKLTPTANDAGATIKVGSGTILTAVTSGTESSAIELSAGTNAIKVEVTARDGATKQTYNLAIHRKDSDNVNPPASPSGLTLTPGERKLDASWTAGAVTSGVNDAPTRYEIYWHESSAANPGWAGLHVFVVTGNPLPTAYEITQLTDGVQYTVYVRACNRGGCSPSPKQTATTGYQPPSTVTLSAASDTVSEGVRGPNNAAGLVIVTATLDVGYATAHSCAVTPGSGSTAKVRPEGSSTSDYDWRLYAYGVRFNAGATSATFNIEVQDDSAEESAETAIIEIDCTGGVTDSLTLTIEDNDGAPAATLWSATLNVADKTTTEAGCDNDKSGAECSTESVLTDDDFIVGATTWSVTAVLSQKVTGALSVKFDRDVRTALDSYSVCIGARALPFSTAAHTGGNTWAEWDGAAADQHWFAGRDPVLVRISERLQRLLRRRPQRPDGQAADDRDGGYGHVAGAEPGLLGGHDGLHRLGGQQRHQRAADAHGERPGRHREGGSRNRPLPGEERRGQPPARGPQQRRELVQGRGHGAGRRHHEDLHRHGVPGGLRQRAQGLPVGVW